MNSFTRLFRRGVFLCLAVAGIAQAGSVTRVSVGSDPACDYSSITQATFGAPGMDPLLIDVAKNINLTGTQLLTTRTTSLIGGYDTCSDTTRSGRTTLDGAGFSGSIILGSHGGASTAYVYMYDLEVTGGNTNTNGGGIALTGNWLLNADNIHVHDNIANGNGGGIALSQGSTRGTAGTDRGLEINIGSIISNNEAENGGGIWCDGDGTLTVANTQVAVNQADTHGGGVYVAGGCDLQLSSSGAFQGIILNDAVSFGGGVFADDNSSVRLIGDSPTGLPAIVSSNSASNGGGIALSTGSILDARDAFITDNSASSTGGGIRSDGGAIFISRASPGAECHTRVRCSQLSGNSSSATAPGFGGGGAILAVGGSIRITGTYVEDNFANFGSAIRARFIPLDGLSRDIDILGNVFAGNSGAPQVVYLDESDADIGFNTFVDNTGNDRIIEIAYPDTPGGPHETRIFGSIFDQAGNTVSSAELTTTGQLPSADCNRNEQNSTGDLVGGSRSTTASPAFVDRNAGNFELDPGSSSMIDYCDWSTLGSLSNHSANGLDRPNDVAAANLHGAWDLGGIEYYAAGSIFADRFEN